jgi:hypothetical protein
VGWVLGSPGGDPPGSDHDRRHRGDHLGHRDRASMRLSAWPLAESGMNTTPGMLCRTSLKNELKPSRDLATTEIEDEKEKCNARE